MAAHTIRQTAQDEIYWPPEQGGVVGTVRILAIGLLLFFASLATATETVTARDGSFVQKFRTDAEIVAANCRIATLSSATANRCDVSTAYWMDFVYVPTAFGNVVNHSIQQAFADGYYANMTKTDFFHGHLISRGPQAVYASPTDFYQDTTLILFHSREYLFDSWDEIPAGEDVHAPLKPHIPRSFVATLGPGATGDISPAIDAIPGTYRLSHSYSGAGTIYDYEMVDTHPDITKHGYHPEETLKIKTCLDESCVPCRINSQLYLLADPNGRWVTPDGIRIEMFLTCKYETPASN